jgi:tocopherol O-methyltransferase
MSRPNEKTKVVQHYDVLSPYYRSLWGEHMHHGYWIQGDESREKAQIQLIEHLARLAEIQPGASILDIGCGIGGSSFFLAKNYGASVTGISTSPVQIEMANRAAQERQLEAKFLLMDAEAMQVSQTFDVLWSMESISHYQDPAKFFAGAVKLLKPGGTFALTDFFQNEGLTQHTRKKYIDPIENSLLLELHEMNDYAAFLTASGLQVTQCEVLNKNCAKTWDIPWDIAKTNRSGSWPQSTGRNASGMCAHFKRCAQDMRAVILSTDLSWRNYHRTKTLSVQAIEAVESGGLVAFGQSRIVENGVDEVGDLPFEQQDRLPDVQEFRGIFPKNVHAEKLQSFAVE